MTGFSGSDGMLMRKILKNGGGTKIIDVTMGIIMGRGDMTDRTRESTKKFGDSLGQSHPKMGIKTIQMVLYYTGDGIRKVCWEVNSCSQTTRFFSVKKTSWDRNHRKQE